MAPAEFDDSIDDARRLLSEVVRHYSATVAPGEVGGDGTGLAEASSEVLGGGPIGLLYGRIQSGKTRAMVFSSAMAFDNGFRIVVVLTSDNTELVQQTAERFGVLTDGGVVCVDSGQADWMLDRSHIETEMAHGGLVVVCAKNARHLNRLQKFLGSLSAGRYPAIFFDDEGDQATLDTAESRRARNPSAEIDPSRIHQQTVSVDHDHTLGESLRQVLAHSVYVQVTATPQALLLQGLEDRPAFTVLIEPGKGYLGGDFFFNENAVGTGRAPLRFVDDAEGGKLHDSNVQAIPVGLQVALDTFCLGAGLAEVRGGRGEKYTFLCQTSHKTDEHESADRLIRSSLKSLLEEIRANSLGRLVVARNELARSGTIEDHEFTDAIHILEIRLRSRNVALVNSKNDRLAIKRGLNFLTGGNILGRGLTLPNLLVTYYLRAPKAPQQDTMWQQARMFGYRADLKELLRVFIPPTLASRFGAIADTERSLREQCDCYGQLNGKIAVRTAGRLKPTRGAVLPTNNIDAIRGGRPMHPHYPEYRSSKLGKATLRIDQLIAAQVLNGPLKAELDRSPGDRRLHKVPIKVLVELIKSTPTRAEEEAPELWNVDGLVSILQAKYGSMEMLGHLWIRESDRRNTEGQGRVPTGMHGRRVDAPALTSNEPVLMLFRSDGSTTAGWAGVPFWYPTIRLPEDEIWLVNSQ